MVQPSFFMREGEQPEPKPPSRDVTFYVGSQAKRQHVFSVLGVFWPPR